MKRFVFALLLLCLPAFILRPIAAQAQHSENTGLVRPGVVIEQLAKNSEAEKAGLREGDLLLVWNYEELEDQIKSPLALYDLEAAQKARGPVRLLGSRNGTQRQWTLGTGAWGIRARPDFSEELLSIYRQGQASAISENPGEAAARFREAAARIPKEQPHLRWAAQWLLLQAGDTLAAARKFQEANVFYREIFEAGEISNRGATYLVWYWANHDQRATGDQLVLARSLNLQGLAARARGEGAKAEEFHLRALEIEEKQAPGGLDVADTLNNLGVLAEARNEHAKAEEYHRRALAIEQKLAPDSLDTAATLASLGLVLSARRDLKQGDGYLSQALEIEQKLAPGGLDITVTTVVALGRHAWRQSDDISADTFLRQAVALQQKLDPESLALANNLASLGLIAIDRGDLIPAEHYHRQALTIREKIAPQGVAVAKSLSSLGLVARGRGDLHKAEQYLRQALAIQKTLPGTDSMLAGFLTNLGVVLMNRSDLDQAENCFQEALKIYEKIRPGSLDVAGRFNNLGTVALDRSELDQAQRFQEKALQIQLKLAPESLETAWSYNNLGNVLKERHDLPGAEQYYRKALALRERLAPGGIFVAQTLNNLAGTLFKNGEPGKSEEAYRQALAIEERLAPESMAIVESLAGLGAIKRDHGHTEEAAQFYERALDSLENQTEHLGGSAEVRSNFRASAVPYYNEYIQLLVEQRRPDEALSVLERSRARSLLDTLATAQVDIRKGVSPALLDKERTLQAAMASATNRRIEVLAVKHTEEQATNLDKEFGELVRQYQQVEDEIRVNSPAYAALVHPKPLSAREIQQQVLDPGTLLLEYALGDERSYVFAVSRESIIAYELPKKADVEAVARPVYDMLAARSRAPKDESPAQRALRVHNADVQYPEAAERLSKMVLGPAAPLMQGNRLLIVRDGILEYVPFAALPSPVAEARLAPLIVDHEIVNLPSASVLQVLRQQEAGRAKASNPIAVLADPVFQQNDSRIKKRGSRLGASNQSPTRPGADDGSESSLLRSASEVGALDGQLNFPRLLFSRKEADAILREAAPGKALKALDFNASLGTAVGPKLSQYRIVHFATHGLLNSLHPELSGLVLSLVDAKGRPQPGFLSLESIYNMTLPVDLVVLSACETGLGKEVQGEGLLGITRGFMYAGASRVVASLWNVNDAATAQLMAKFYSGMFKDHLQPAAALRRAQVEMLKNPRWNLPYYWAGFVIQGEW